MSEYIIENLSSDELQRLMEIGEKEGIDWIPDDITTSDICIYGTERDVIKAMEIIGRKGRDTREIEDCEERR